MIIFLMLLYLDTKNKVEDLIVYKLRSKYEYLLPYLTFEKNLSTSEKYGIFDLSSNLRVRNYDVNKQTEFFVNDINWKSNKWIGGNFLTSQLKGKLKTVTEHGAN